MTLTEREACWAKLIEEGGFSEGKPVTLPNAAIDSPTGQSVNLVVTLTNPNQSPLEFDRKDNE